jgi:hypothetical protein
MKNLLIISTVLFLVSCRQGNNNEVKKEQTKPVATGNITSIADGFDVQRVNIFNSTSSNRTINCYLKNGDKVNILEDVDPYYLVEKMDEKTCRGYCMKGFVILK